MNAYNVASPYILGTNVRNNLANLIGKNTGIHPRLNSRYVVPKWNKNNSKIQILKNNKNNNPPTHNAINFIKATKNTNITKILMPYAPPSKRANRRGGVGFRYFKNRLAASPNLVYALKGTNAQGNPKLYAFAFLNKNRNQNHEVNKSGRYIDIIAGYEGSGYAPRLLNAILNNAKKQKAKNNANMTKRNENKLKIVGLQAVVQKVSTIRKRRVPINNQGMKNSLVGFYEYKGFKPTGNWKGSLYPMVYYIDPANEPKITTNREARKAAKKIENAALKRKRAALIPPRVTRAKAASMGP